MSDSKPEDPQPLPAAELMAQLYEELRRLAARWLRQRASPDRVVQPTMIVHEAFLRLAHQPGSPWQDRRHFFAIAATAMRQVLVDHARHALREKRGGGWQRVTLSGLVDGDQESGTLVDLVALDQVMSRLAELDPRQARIVDLRFFGGLTMDEIAGVLGVSTRTVEKEWRRVRAWLGRQLQAP